MTDLEIHKFIERFNWGDDIPVLYYYEKSLDSSIAFLFESIIYVNKFYKNCKRVKKIYIQASLIHEVGHKYTQFMTRSLAMKEYLAQEWAIERCKALKWKKLEKFLRHVFELWYTESKWMSKDRKYLMAAQLAKQRKMF